MKTCPVCNKVVTDQAKFCFFCGASLLNAEAEPIIPAVEPEAEPFEAQTAELSEPETVVIPEPEPVYAPEPEPVYAPQPEPVYAPEPEPVFSAKAEPAPAPEPVPVAPVNPEPVEPKSEQPIIVSTDSRSLMTAPGYFFTTILFHIPVIGLIFMIIWGCGKTKNLSRKRFSLACLIMRLLGYILVLSAAVFLLICFSGKFPILTKAFAEFFS